MKRMVESPDIYFAFSLVKVAEFFDATIAKGADVKLAANWIMGDIAAYLKNEKLSIDEIKLTPQELAELIASIKGGTISGKIGKEVKHVLKHMHSNSRYYLLTNFVDSCWVLGLVLLQLVASIDRCLLSNTWGSCYNCGWIFLP